MKTVIKAWLSCKKAVALHLLGIICGILSKSIYLYMTDLTSRIITGDVQRIKASMWILLYVGLAASFFNVMQNLLRGQDLVYTRLFSDFVRKVIHADYDMYTKTSCSQVLTASGKIWNIGAAGKSMMSLGSAAVMLGVTWVAVFIKSKVVALVVIPVYLIVAIIVRKLCKAWSATDKEVDLNIRSRAHELDSVINGFMEVRSNTTEERHEKSLIDKNNKLYSLSVTRRFISANITMVYCLISYLGTAAATGYSVWAISEGSMTTAAGLALFVYMMDLISPLDTIISYIDDITANASVLGDYDAVMAYDNRIEDGDIELTSFEDCIRIENLAFEYDDSAAVLTEVNMTIPKGKHVGICGVSGGGKTTLFKLLQKYYLPTHGAIKIDGIDYRKLTTESVRKKIAVVSQDPYIFDGTIYDNMVYGMGEKVLSEMGKHEVLQRVRDVAAITGIDKFVDKLEDEYDTIVGPRGIKLSGGQQQRIVFARALLSEPEILLLDEATSALDNISERTIQNAIERYGESMTVITIAHRLDTIKSCDNIFVFAEHTVVAEGGHYGLMQTCEEYRNMVNAKMLAGM